MQTTTDAQIQGHKDAVIIIEAQLKKAKLQLRLAEGLSEHAFLKQEFFQARTIAEKSAYAYFAACPVGTEREWASEVYETIRNATRVYR